MGAGTERYHFACLIVVLAVQKSLGCVDVAQQLADAGYTKWPDSDKNYQLYKSPKNHLEARLTCQASGARLAIISSQEDLEAVQDYYGDLDSSGMWVGLVNPALQKCGDTSSGGGGLIGGLTGGLLGGGGSTTNNCGGKLSWLDGSTSLDFVGSETNVEVFSYCLSMVNSDAKMVGTDCKSQLPFLCQYDCQNPITSETCPAADLSSDLIFNNNVYKYQGDAVKSYEDAGNACHDKGGWLPTVENEDAHYESKILAAYDTVNFWIGLHARPGKTPTCYWNAWDCNDMLTHHTAKDTYSDFTGYTSGDYFQAYLQVKESLGSCIVSILYPNHGVAFKSHNCSANQNFYCKMDCQGCGVPPTETTVDNMVRNWSEQTGGVLPGATAM